MPTTQLPEVPDSLSNLKPYLKLAAMHDERDLVVAYWFRLEAIQQGLRISTKSMEETQFFMKLMQWLEETKKANHENEAITNDVVAQAHLENWALKLFLYADENDRAGNFNKNVIQAFYTSSMIYQLIKTFGPLNEEAERNMKYAKWKSVYINNCLKKGETPVSGPLETEENEDNEDSNVVNPDGMEEIAKNEDDEYLDAVTMNYSVENDEEQGENEEKPHEEEDANADSGNVEENKDEEKNSKPEDESEEKVEENNDNPTTETEQGNEEDKEKENVDPENEDKQDENEEANDQADEKPKDESEEENDEKEASTSKNSDLIFPSVPSSSSNKTTNDPKTNTSTPVTPIPPYNPAPTPTSDGSIGSFDSASPKAKPEGGAELNIEQMERAKKLIKWAGSALNYDDVPTAITNLQQALNLLSTGSENA